MATEEIPENLKESASEIARRFENKRTEIAKEITKAEILMDQRSIVIWTGRFLDAWPQGRLSKIERAVKAVFEQKLKDAKFHLTATCPVCGDHMHGTLCPDDVIRPWCPTCHKAYTPLGYTTDDDYAKKWSAREYSRDKAESYTVVEVTP